MQSSTLSNFYRFDLVDNVESKYPARQRYMIIFKTFRSQSSCFCFVKKQIASF